MEFKMTKQMLGGVVLFVLINLSAALQAAENPRPNIVLILADDLGFSDLPSYGSEVETPNIDQLANNGVRFSNYHTAASCAPTSDPSKIPGASTFTKGHITAPRL